jgi:hypothetical protein
MARNKRKKVISCGKCSKKEEVVKVVGKRPYISKKATAKKNLNSGDLRKVLLIVTEENRNWAGVSVSNYVTDLTVVYVKNYSEVKSVLKSYAIDMYDVVVLAPRHGVKEEPKLVWSSNGYQTLTYPCVLEAFRVATHVHICTCYQGIVYNINMT